MFKIKTFSILLALAAAAVPMSALAQNAPPADPPSYSRPAATIPGEDTIRGRVVSFDGAFSLQVDDERGFVDNVRLHDGTIINPTGVRLAPGMSVTIHGVNQGNILAANEIDTPYSTYGSAYVYGYPYGPYAAPVYPYPVYGYPYGPAFSVGIGFGGGFYGHGRFR